jgi:O-antigen biosynthesis protein
MNILLMTSPRPQKTAFSFSEKMPPLGIGFLISVLKQNGHKTFFIDNLLDHQFDPNILINNKINYVGLYLDTICFLEGKKIILEIDQIRQQRSWNGKIMVGGPHPSVRPEDIPDCVDYIVRGEGEVAIIEAIDGGKNRIIEKAFLADLDELPRPDWGHFINLPYDFSCDFFQEKPVFNQNTSRGCPFSCKFCSIEAIWGKTNRAFSAERMVDDMEFLKATYGARGFYFREDNFVCNKKRIHDFCELILKKNLSMPWACETRVDTLDKDVLALMSRAGCRGIFFGVESGNQRTLDFLSKGTTIEKIKTTFHYCRELRIKTYASFMVGLPGETKQELLDTIKLAAEIKPSNMGFNIFVGIPYSRFYHYLKNHHLYESIDESGMLYIKNHNLLVDQLLGGLQSAKIPQKNNKTLRGRRHLLQKQLVSEADRKIVAKFFFQLAGKLLLHDNKREARTVCLSSLHYNFLSLISYLLLFMTLLPTVLIGVIRKIQLKYLPYI